MARDVAIVGGGVIGLTCAYFLARRGARATLFDGNDFGTQASWAGAGIVPPGDSGRGATPLDRLRGRSSSLFPAFTAELRELTGIDTGYRVTGGIESLEPHDADAPRLWEAEGIAFEPFRQGHEPNVRLPDNPAYFLPGFAQVRNPWHVRALIEACRRAGVVLCPRTPVTGFETVNSRVSALKLGDGGMHRTDRILLCPGAWAGGLLAKLGCDPGVKPVRGQIALLKSAPETLSRVVMVGKRYLVPRGDGLILVGSTEEPEAGFTLGTTADAVAGLRDFAGAVVPKLAGAELVQAWSGLRPGSPDGLPYLGRVPGWENAFAATGHFRAGVQLSPGTAELMTRLVLDGAGPDGIFALDRVPAPAPRPAFRS